MEKTSTEINGALSRMQWLRSLRRLYDKVTPNEDSESVAKGEFLNELLSSAHKLKLQPASSFPSTSRGLTLNELHQALCAMSSPQLSWEQILDLLIRVGMKQSPDSLQNFKKKPEKVVRGNQFSIQDLGRILDDVDATVLRQRRALDSRLVENRAVPEHFLRTVPEQYPEPDSVNSWHCTESAYSALCFPAVELLYLSLSGLGLSECAQGLSCTLLVLNISGNNIKTLALPCALNALKLLNARDNQIRKLAALTQAPSLTELYLGHNFIQKANSLCGVKSLKILELGHNRIVKLEDLASLSILKLHSLVLKGNPLAARHDYPANITQLLSQMCQIDPLALTESSQFQNVPLALSTTARAKPVPAVPRRSHKSSTPKVPRKSRSTPPPLHSSSKPVATLPTQSPTPDLLDCLAEAEKRLRPYSQHLNRQVKAVRPHNIQEYLSQNYGNPAGAVMIGPGASSHKR